MNPVIIRPENTTGAVGLIVAEEIRHNGKRAFHKGHRLTPNDLPTLAALDQPVHAVRLEPGEVHEDDAATTLATLISGDGLDIRRPVQSRANIYSAHRGLLRVDSDAVIELNLLPDIAIFTTIDRLPVGEKHNVAGAKITPIATRQTVLDQARAFVESLDHPIVTVKPFVHHTVGILATEGLSVKIRDRFESAVRRKLDWYGSDVLRFAYLHDNPDDVAATIRAMLAEGADLILTAGGNTIDPFDPTIRALPDVDARIVRLGAPAHPGSMFWYGSTNDDSVAIVNLASCSMYSESTVADLVLPWVMANEPISERDLASIGYGGLLDRDMQWRFPPYDEGDNERTGRQHRES